MKRMFWVLALALCFCLTAACGAEDIIDNARDETAEEPGAAQAQLQEEEAVSEAAAEAEDDADESDDSDTDLTTAPDESEDSATDTDEAEQADTWEPDETYDFSSWTVEECVEDGWDFEGVLPHITVPCAGADEINAAIESGFTQLAEDPMANVYYECSKGADRVLCVVMICQVESSLEYTVYHLDLATGQRITGQELLALLGVDKSELAGREIAVMSEEFTHLFGTAQDQEDEEYYNEQYALTTAADNTELERVWVGAQGQLYFVGRIYSLTGAESYEYAMDTGMVF